MSKEEDQNGPSILSQVNDVRATLPIASLPAQLNPILVGFDAYMMGVSD